MDKFNELRNKYSEFIYENSSYTLEGDYFVAKFKYIIPGLTEFNPSIKFSKNIITNQHIDNNLLNYIVFNIGLVEMISFYKTVCSSKITINAGYINSEQINWFKKLIYNGLGEFFYKNNININQENLVDISCSKENENISFDNSFFGEGNLIPVGGGKDSCVSLEILNGENNSIFVINPNEVQLNCAYAAGYNDKNIIRVIRDIEKDKLIDLNNQGFLNGHIPISAVIAFISYLCAYLSNKKNIVLSNEASANESTIIGSNINHQYSKTLEFENDFRNYVDSYFKTGINYYSLLRGLSEFEIANIFSKYEKYFDIFKSCNLGSKNSKWDWCCSCPKCLFVYIILSPNLYKDKLVKIFGEDLFERNDLLNTFLEIIGESETKPFECVGTISEAKYAISLLINKLDINNLPYLLDYYYKNFDLYLDETNITNYSENNNVPSKYTNIILDLLKGDIND